MQISLPQRRVLEILAGRNPIRRIESDGTFVPCNLEVRTIQSLVKKGLAKRVGAGVDGYIYTGYVITLAGRAALSSFL